MREREERERNAAKVTVTRPVWAQLGGAIAVIFKVSSYLLSQTSKLAC